MAKRSDTSREWVTVLEGLEAVLLAGGLKAGDRLPSERSLASSLRVHRSSVREALRVLEVLSLVSMSTGSQLGSAGILMASPSGGMGALMRLQVAAQGFRVNDIIRTRLLLEGAVAKSLAESSDTIDLSHLNDLLATMDDPRLSPVEFIALNGKFHLALAEASGNKIVTAVMSGLRHSIEVATYEGADDVADWSATVTRLQREHRDLLRIISEGDGPEAARKIQDHISGYYDETHLPHNAS
jgi:DNA-binding FadR family transcriptional regulator